MSQTPTEPAPCTGKAPPAQYVRMFFALPIRDEPNPPGTPVVNYVLIGINVAVYLLVTLPLSRITPDPSDPEVQNYLINLSRETGVGLRTLLANTSAYEVFTYKYGFRPGSPSVLTLFTSMFLHGGLMHLAGNMLFLWIFGDNIEYHLGRWRYVFVYVLTGSTATAFFAVFQLDSQVPMVGASGAISGVLGCYFIWFPNNRVRVLTVILWLIDVHVIPARWVLGFYLLVSNVLPFLFSSGSGGGVAYGAHIGGFLGGMGIAYAFDRWLKGQRAPREPQRFRRRTTRVTENPQLAFRTAIGDGNGNAALREYSLMSPAERHFLTADDVFALADWLVDARKFEAALSILQRYIATHPTSRDLGGAHLRAGLIHLRALERPTTAYQHLLAALELEPSPDVERAAREGLAEIDRRRHRSLWQ